MTDLSRAQQACLPREHCLGFTRKIKPFKPLEDPWRVLFSLLELLRREGYGPDDDTPPGETNPTKDTMKLKRRIESKKERSKWKPSDNRIVYSIT